MAYKYKTLKEFYPYYLTEHQDVTSRTLHFIGTSGFIGVTLYAILTQTWWLLAIGPVFAYGFAWVGHFIFEKNKPATFVYPAFSLASDFIMLFHMATFQIGRKLEEAKAIIAAEPKD